MMLVFDIGDVGWMLFIIDLIGVVVGLWQVNWYIGVMLVNEMGMFIWNELFMDKLDLVLVFYEVVVGFIYLSMEIVVGQNYWVFKVGDVEVGGCMELLMFGVLNYWYVYFVVDDVDVMVVKVVVVGGQVIVELVDILLVGWFVVLFDLQGVIFSVLKFVLQ